MKAQISEILKYAVLVFGWIVALIKKHKEEIAAIVKRVEADAEDGWTKEEKLALAKELFENKVYPRLPWYLKMFGKKWLWKRVVKAIDKICEKAKEIK